MLEDINGHRKKLLKTYRTTRDHNLGAWLLLLTAFVSTVGAAIMGFLLRATVIKNSRSPALSLLFSAAYVVAIVAAARSIGEAGLRFVRGFSKASKRTLLLTLLRGSPWLGPVIIVCSVRSIMTVLSLGAMAFFEGRLLGQFVDRLNSIAEAPSEIRSRKSLFDFSGSLNAATQQFNLTLAICIAYLGILAVVTHLDNAIAAALIASSAFIVGWIKQESTPTEKQSPATLAIWGRPAIWAIFVTLLTLLPRAGSFDLRQLAGRLLIHEQDSSLGKLQSGVILFVKRRPPTPLQLAQGAKFHSEGITRSLSIPFSGEYWFFPRPRSPVPGDDWFFQRIHKRPPASSLREEGDPTNIHVTLEDTDEMVMQAQQPIGQSAELRSWRWVDLILEGEDEQPQKVDIELLLVNSSARGQEMQTLGVRSLTNPVSVSTSDNLKMTSFRFAIPPTSEIQSFNELFVWFHLKAPRMQKGTTVKIDRFDLIP